MIRTVIFIFGLIFFFFFSYCAVAQDKKLEMGPAKIGLNQYFKITLTVENERLKKYSQFPEIEGFVKRGTSSSTSTSFINGRMTSSQSITQNYQATRKGNFRVEAFTMEVNGEVVRGDAFNIEVTEATQNQQRRSSGFTDPFDLFRDRNDRPTEFLDVEAEAFLALTTDKSEVYVGEGFTTTLAFYVAENNRAELRFYDLTSQITDIIKKIKPENCWEENFNIEEINGVPVTINNRGYTQYKVYQAAFYPLNADDIAFPSVGLKMIKYKVAKNPTFFGRNRQEDFETFYSKSKEIEVNPLPPHPLRDQVAVGNYRLAEKINTLDLKTGESFNYSFNVIGEGNISAIEAPEIPSSEDFDFYAPNTQQDINRASGRVRGTKSFGYYAIPNEPGTYNLGDYFSWIFFNPEKEQYDTLRSRQVLNVSGESRKNEYILSNDMGSFYDGLEYRNNELVSLDGSSWIQIFANVFVLAMLVLTGFLLFRK